MGIFATRGRRTSPAAPESRAELTEGLLADIPPALAAVGEALVSEAEPVDACAVAGLELALAGVSLDEALVGLESASRLVRGHPPAFAATRALAAAWSEATLGYLHQISCADPVTGLSSLAHLQSRLPELYRGELRGRPLPHERHVLVVVDLDGHRLDDVLSADLRLAGAAETVGTVFTSGEQVTRLGRDRLVVLAGRDDRLPRRTTLLSTLLDAGLNAGPNGGPGTRSGPRVWVEGLPATAASASALVAELARG